MEKLKIKEIIVVEGRDDITAVKRAVDAQLIMVRGFAVEDEKTIAKIKDAQHRVGVIILTDPDHAGKKIRATIKKYVPQAKDAYISRSEGTRSRDGNIGIENASPEAIIAALEKVRTPNNVSEEAVYTTADLIDFGLIGGNKALKMRQLLGHKLGIGYSNGKQFLNKLNHYRIPRVEVLNALREVEQEKEKEKEKE